MSSLYTDTIRKTGGTAGTDIRIKNTSVYETEGGTSVTLNIVQGLAKGWADIAAGGASLPDSFNCSSVDDDGTGDYGVNFTSAMSSSSHSIVPDVTHDHSSGSSSIRVACVTAKQTGSLELKFAYLSASAVWTQYDIEADGSVAIFGDLA